MNTITYKWERFGDYSEFYDFIKEVEQDFVPPLLSRINPYEYYRKISTFADVIKCFVDGELACVAVMYANNFITRKGFVTFIATRLKFRGMHIASCVLKKCFHRAKCKGMLLLDIETNSKVARACYLKVGFTEESTIIIDNSDLSRFYFSKKL